jgi:hypothetical protein
LFISATTTTTSLLFLSLQGYNATLCLPFSRSLSMSICAKTPDPMSELLLKTQKKSILVAGLVMHNLNCRPWKFEEQEEE